MAEDFFGEYPELTPEEVDEYAHLAHSWVDSLLNAENSSEVTNCSNSLTMKGKLAKPETKKPHNQKTFITCLHPPKRCYLPVQL